MMPEEALIDWPEATLGCPARQAYRSAPAARFRTIEVLDGPSRLRLTQDVVKKDYSIQFNWTGAQLTEFSTFYHTTLNAGAEWFNMNVLTGLGLLPHLCHFSGPYSISPVDRNLSLYIASFVVEAYAQAWEMPAALVILDPVDASAPADELPDSYDGRSVADTRPTDSINALVPKAHS
jgi:hypothetical protein